MIDYFQVSATLMEALKSQWDSGYSNVMQRSGLLGLLKDR